jgi:hypothetical protein
MRFMKLGQSNKGAMHKSLSVAMALILFVAAAGLAAQPPTSDKLGEAHKLFSDSEGTWDATIKSPLGDSKGMLTCQVGLLGRWHLEQVTGDFAGVPFEGRNAISYDPGKKKYISVWIDSVSSSPTISEGTYDKTTKTMTLVGSMPLPNGKSMKSTQIIVFNDANSKIYTLIGTDKGGKDLEMMKVTYKRRAK